MSGSRASENVLSGLAAVAPTDHGSDEASPKLACEIMQTKIVTISAGERLSTVEDIMTLGGVRHMPVVSGGELVGVVSERDLLRASLSNLHCFGSAERRAFLHAVEISEVMSKPPIVISLDTPVRRAARILAERKIGCLPVTDERGALVGLLTETDVLRYFALREPDPSS